MKNENLVKNWLEFADMDASLAEFSFANMHPKPLELICYHCQQAAEKALAGKGSDSEFVTCPLLNEW